MTVTDEMIEALRVACRDAFGNELLTDLQARAALTAALKIAPVGVVNDWCSYSGETPAQFLRRAADGRANNQAGREDLGTLANHLERLPECLTAPAGVGDRETLARTIAYAGRDQTDRSEDADHFWAYTGEAGRAKAYRQADAILSTLTTREEVERIKQQRNALAEHIEVLLEEDPNASSDMPGATILDQWRHDAIHRLGVGRAATRSQGSAS